jgi:hypothetical protein
LQLHQHHAQQLLVGGEVLLGDVCGGEGRDLSEAVDGISPERDSEKDKDKSTIFKYGEENNAE